MTRLTRLRLHPETYAVLGMLCVAAAAIGWLVGEGPSALAQQRLSILSTRLMLGLMGTMVLTWLGLLLASAAVALSNSRTNAR